MLFTLKGLKQKDSKYIIQTTSEIGRIEIGNNIVTLCTCQAIIITWTALSTAAADATAGGQQPRDLDLQESRYKVKAKPEPYKPPQPAPNFDDFHPGAQASVDAFCGYRGVTSAFNHCPIRISDKSLSTLINLY